MKTLHPVDDTTLAKIGKAYLICSEYPDVFGNVRMDRFCSMFVDVIPDDESERDARIRARADEIYGLIHTLAITDAPDTYIACFLEFKNMARELLDYIDGKEEDDE